MAKQWTPPADAVPVKPTQSNSSWTPPSDAVPVKKKSSSASNGGQEKGFGASVVQKVTKDILPSESSSSPGIATQIANEVKESIPVTSPRLKAINELGKDAPEDKIAERESFYKNIDKQKTLRASGYDVDLTGNLQDEKTASAFKLYGAKMETVKKSKAKSDAFSSLVDKSINPSLILSNEEDVVKQLRNRFGSDGFIFDETGLGDAITVTYSPDGARESEPITIDLQTFFDNGGEVEKLKSYMKQKYMPDYERSIVNAESYEGTAEEKEQIAKKYYKDVTKLMASDPHKYGPELIAEDQFENYLTESYRNIGISKKQLEQEYSKLDRSIEAYNTNPTPEAERAIKNETNRLKVKEYNLKKELYESYGMEVNYKKALGAYAEDKSKSGSWLGGVAVSLAKGLSATPRAALNIASDVIPNVLPNAGLDPVTYDNFKKEGLSDDQIESRVASNLKRTIGKEVDQGIANIASLGTTTEEYLGSKDRGIVQQAVNGLSESIGASLSGGSSKALQGIAFFSQSYNNMEGELSGKEFDDMSIWEKKAISVSYGIVIGQLEKLGFNASAGISKNPLVKKLINNTLAKTFSGISKDASVHAIEEAIGKNLGATLASSGLRIVAGGLAEGGTEGTQQLAEIGLKNIVNNIHGKDYFENVPDITTAEGLKEALKLAASDAAVGAIGGMIMGSFDTYRTNKDENTRDEKFETMYESLSDDKFRKSVIMNVKFKLKDGLITKEQAKNEIRDINETTSVISSIPAEYSVREKRVAFDLISEKKTIESEIHGKDPSLVAVQKDRIKAIEEELVGISVKAAGQKTEGAPTDKTSTGAPVVDNNTTRTTDKQASPAKVTDVDTQISEESVPERRETLKAASKVQTAFTGTGVKVIVHKTSSDYAAAVNELTDNKESSDNRTSARFIPEANEIHVDLDTAEPMSAYHEAFHAKVRNMDTQQINNLMSDFKKVVQGSSIIENKLADFVAQYGDGDVSEEAFAELTGIMVETATTLEKTSLQKFIEFINKMATAVGLPTLLRKSASRGEVVGLMNDLSNSIRSGKTVTQDPGVAAKTDSSRKIPKERLDAVTGFDTTYNNLVKEGVAESTAYEQALSETTSRIGDDVLRESAIRDVARKYGRKVVSAPKVDKILNKPKPKKVIVDEAKGLADIIRREAKAARDKKAQVKEVLTNISDSVKEMQKTGKISVRQMSSILSALKTVNLDNKVAVDRFVSYVGKAVDKAEFTEKVDQAIDLRKKIKKSFKGKSNPFVTVAKGFSELNPKWVENIDDYLDIASKVRESLRTTSIRGDEIKFKKEASGREVGEYTAREQELQDEITAENIRVQYEKVTGNAPSAGMSVGDMRAELFALGKKEDESGEEGSIDVIREILREKLIEFKSVITKEDPTEVQEAAKVDIDILDTRTAIRLLDALDSYMANESTSGLRAQLASYRGLKNIQESTLKSRGLRLAGSKKIGRFQNEQFTNMNILTERIFRGVSAGLRFRKESGIQDIINGANKAETEAIKVQNEYLKKFGKVKGFDSAENIFERNVIAFLRRNTIAGDTDAEFSRRKKLLKDSVSVLKRGNDLERKKGELYEEVLSKLGVGESATLDGIESRAVKTNIEAVDYITFMWSDLYSELADFSLGVHNIMLPRDSNYTPDRFASVENARSLEDQVDQNSFGFGSFNNIILDKNEAGVLMESKKPKSLPKGRYVDLDFDTNMFRSYKLALTDMYTAEPIRQAYSYMRDNKFGEMVNAEDRKILQNAVSDYVTAKKGKAFADRDTFEYLRKLTNFIASMGAARALAGFGQAVNQYSTAMTNTFVNAGLNLRPGEIANKEAMEFINRSGRSIANRGVDVVTTIEKADTIVEGARVGGLVQKYTTEQLDKANTFMLKWLLSKPDVAAARTSWLAYYRKSMKEQRLKVDYSGEVNDKAADYAQAMIDRNMDVSDTELRGKFFRDKGAIKGFVKQIYFPFSTFALNQKNRLWSDASIVTSKTASVQDKTTAFRSLAALSAEMVMYNGIRYLIGKAILEAALEALDLDDEDKEEYRAKYQRNISESVLSKGILDLVSPTPILDNQVLKGTNKILEWTGIGAGKDSEFDEMIKAENERRYLLYEDPLTEEEIEKKKLTFAQEKQFQFFVDDEKSYGTMGIQADKSMETYDIMRAWKTGEYTQESSYGDQEKVLSKEGQDKLLLPMLMKTGAMLVLPREADQLSNRIFSIVKKKYGMTENQSKKAAALKEMGILVDDEVMKMIKAKKGVPTTVDGLYDEIKYINSLNSVEKKKYMKKLGL